MPTRRPARVLILSNEPMSAALIGLLLEASTYEPAFAHPGETAEAALRRVRPVFVILLDVELDVARSDLFYTRAERSGVRVILYGRATDSDMVGALAATRGLRSFTLPISGGGLAMLLEESAPEERRDASRGPRRASVTPGGEALLFTDRRGQRWYVYDRRASERRAENRPDTTYRAFVN